jgi:GT2 family glycosyltransferase
MRVLAHIHTYNDADVIDRTIEALLQQTRSVDGILVVDNASTDATLKQPSLQHATVLCHHENLGTSGTIITGMQFALEHGYDWIWILDADSTPEPEALERLLDLYAGWPRSQQERTAFLSCLPYNEPDGLPLHGGIFTSLGRVPVTPTPEQLYYCCHVTNWSGCLYRLAAVRAIGLPNPDYVLDWGEYEYAYRVMKAGYKAFIHQHAVLRHNIRGGPGRPAFRCYYTCRNVLYFALYETNEGRIGLLRGAVWRVLPSPGRPGFMRGAAWRTLLFALSFLIRPWQHGEQILACFRGIWHGFTGNIAARY